MASIDWPFTLPQEYQQSGFSVTPQGVLLRTKMDSGPPKVRRNYTGGISDLSGNMVMTNDQLNTFIDFFENDLGYGVNIFNLPNPINLEKLVEVRFKISLGQTPYSAVPYEDSTEWIVTINLASDLTNQFDPVAYEFLLDNDDEVLLDDAYLRIYE